MTDSELALGVVGAQGDIGGLSKVGVANATSTTEVASCTPTLTACSPHFMCWWTISCQHVGVQAGAQGSPTPSSSRSRSRRSCWTAIPSGGFCVSRAVGWGTCSLISPSSRATTSACARSPRGSAWSSTNWRGSLHPSTIGCGCWTPRPCRVALRGRPSSARELAGWAAYGYCASHSRYFWGLRLYLLCAPDGMPVYFARRAGERGRARGRCGDARTSPQGGVAPRRRDHSRR